MWNNDLISMHMMQTTLEDIQKWWGIIVAEIDILFNILFQGSLTKSNIYFYSNLNSLMF